MKTRNFAAVAAFVICNYVFPSNVCRADNSSDANAVLHFSFRGRSIDIAIGAPNASKPGPDFTLPGNNPGGNDRPTGPVSPTSTPPTDPIPGATPTINPAMNAVGGAVLGGRPLHTRTTTSTKTQTKAYKNRSIRPQSARQYALTLFNDDSHSYADVALTLARFGATQAQGLAFAQIVDQQGMATITGGQNLLQPLALCFQQQAFRIKFHPIANK